MSEQTAAAQNADSRCIANAFFGKTDASVATQSQRCRRTSHQRLCPESPPKSSSAALNVANDSPAHLPVEMSGAGACNSHGEERAGGCDAHNTSNVQPTQHSVVDSNSSRSHDMGSLISEKATTASASQKDRVTRAAEGGRGGAHLSACSRALKDEACSGPAKRWSSSQSSATPERPGETITGKAAVVQRTTDSRSFPNALCMKDSLTSSHFFGGDNVGGEGGSISNGNTVANACEYAPSHMSFPLSAEERLDVQCVYQTYRERSTTAASTQEGFVTALRELYAKAHERANTTAPFVSCPSLTAPELLQKAEMCFGTVRFREIMDSVSGGASASAGDTAAARAPFTLQDALGLSGVLKFEFTPPIFVERIGSDSSPRGTPQRSKQRPTATRGSSDEDGIAAEGSSTHASHPSGVSPVALPLAAGRRMFPHAPKSSLSAEASLTSGSAGTCFSPSPPRAASRKAGTRSPNSPAALSTAPPPTAAMDQAAATLACAPCSEANLGAAAPPSLFITSKADEAKHKPLARRGTGVACHRKVAPLAPSSACKCRSDSALLRDATVRAYMVRKAFAELTDGCSGAHRCVGFERLAEVLRLFELGLNPAAMWRVCGGVRQGKEGNTEGVQIDYTTFERLIEAGLRCPLGAEHHSHDQKGHAKCSAGAGQGEDTAPAVLYLLMSTEPSSVHAAGATPVLPRSGGDGHPGNTVSDTTSQQGNYGGNDPPTLGLATGSASHRTVSRSVSTSSLAASITSLTRSSSDTDDAYPAIAAHGSAIAVLCREMRSRLRAAVFHGADGNAEGKHLETASQPGERIRHKDSPSLNPPSPPFTTSSPAVLAAAASNLSPPLAARSADASVGVSSLSPCVEASEGSQSSHAAAGNEVYHTSPSAPRSSTPAETSLSDQSGPGASKSQFLSPAKRLPAELKTQQPQQREHCYDHQADYQQPPAFLALHSMPSREALQQWQHDILPPSVAAQRTAPYLLVPASTTTANALAIPSDHVGAGEASQRGHHRHSNNSNAASAGAGGDASMRPHSPQGSQPSGYRTLPLCGATQVVAHRPSRHAPRTTAATNGPIHQRSSKSCKAVSPASGSPTNLFRRRTPRWERIVALSPYYTPQSKPPLQRYSNGNNTGVYAHLAGAVRMPWRQRRLVNEEPFQSPAQQPLLHGLPRTASPVVGARSPTLQLRHLSSLAPQRSSRSPYAPSTDSLASFTTHTVPHQMHQPKQPSTTTDATSASDGSSSLQLQIHSPQRRERQQSSALRSHQSSDVRHPLQQKEQLSAVGVPAQVRCGAPPSHHPPNRSAGSTASPYPYTPTVSLQQLRRTWVLAELSDLFMEHEVLTNRLAALKRPAASRAPGQPMPQRLSSALSSSPSPRSSQTRQQEAEECEAALRAISRLIHCYLMELAVLGISVDDNSMRAEGNGDTASCPISSDAGERRDAKPEEVRAPKGGGYSADVIAANSQASFAATPGAACRSISSLSDVACNPMQAPPMLLQREITTSVPGESKSEASRAVVGSFPSRYVSTVLSSLKSDPLSSPKAISRSADKVEVPSSVDGRTGGEDEGGRYAGLPSRPPHGSSTISEPTVCCPQRSEDSNFNSNQSSYSPTSLSMHASTVLPGGCSMNSGRKQRPPMLATLALSGTRARAGRSPSFSMSDSSKLLAMCNEDAETVTRSSCELSANDGAKASKTSTLLPGVNAVSTGRVASGACSKSLIVTATTTVATQRAPSTDKHNSVSTVLSNPAAHSSVDLPPLRTLSCSPPMMQPLASSFATSVSTTPTSLSSTAMTGATQDLHGYPSPLTATTTPATALECEGMYDDDSPSPRANVYLEWAVTQLEKRQHLQRQCSGGGDISSNGERSTRITSTNGRNTHMKSLMSLHSNSSSAVHNGHAHSTMPTCPRTTSPTNGSWPVSRAGFGSGLRARSQTGANRSTASSGRAMPNSLSASKQSSEIGLAAILTNRQSSSLPTQCTTESDDRPSHIPSSVTTLTDESPLLGYSVGERAALLRRSVATGESLRSHNGSAMVGHLKVISLGSSGISQVSGISAPLDFLASTTGSASAQSRTGGLIQRLGHSSTTHRATRSATRQYGGSENIRSYSAFEKTVSSSLPAGFSGSMFPKRDADGNVIHEGD
ncbi:hemagglutinin-like protein [Leptomonas seymouri]|uniref:Hemagglutinin-like protein n=1 Tax=Leptomonas seymouri TaxID=5684 RepID=A0A0N1PE98_LEPSE|nr:hemagglutinin-like protein [Leptomonas seymouri]|eukprot:KPI88570.1 hemagglutinin-like protein [Leptomonas seymouri]